MKVFQHLQLISIKNQFSMYIFVQQLTKIECLQISKFPRYKLVWSSLFEKNYLGDQILYRSVDPPIKKTASVLKTRPFKIGIKGQMATKIRPVVRWWPHSFIFNIPNHVHQLSKIKLKLIYFFEEMNFYYFFLQICDLSVIFYRCVCFLEKLDAIVSNYFGLFLPL